MKFYGLVLCLCLLILTACSTATPLPPTPRPPTAPRPPELPTLAPVEAILPTRGGVTPRATTTSEPTLTPTVFPTPYVGTLDLIRHQPSRGNCQFGSPFGLPSQGMIQLAFIPTGDCQNGELDLIEIGDRLYVAQSGFSGVAFTITDVTDPTKPEVVGMWDWEPRGVTSDLKAFNQGEHRYLALSMQRGRRDQVQTCGIAIVEVTDPRSPQYITRIDGRTAQANEPWCSVHTSEIGKDAQGNATFLYASDVDTFSVRVVDIRDLNNPREVNRYHLHVHPHTLPDQPVLVYVHDSAIVGNRVYLAYWLAGAVILDRAKLEAGLPTDSQTPIIVKPTQEVAPSGFHVHYLYPTADGNFLFLQDELNVQNGLRLLNIRDPQNPREVWRYEVPDAISAPHNFVVLGNLLYAGWYQDGIRVFRFDVSDPNKPTVQPIAYQAVRARAGEGELGPFDGIWGVRVHTCTVQGKPTSCIYASDISAGLVITALDPSLIP